MRWSLGFLAGLAICGSLLLFMKHERRELRLHEERVSKLKLLDTRLDTARLYPNCFELTLAAALVDYGGSSDAHSEASHPLLQLGRALQSLSNQPISSKSEPARTSLLVAPALVKLEDTGWSTLEGLFKTQIEVLEPDISKLQSEVGKPPFSASQVGLTRATHRRVEGNSEITYSLSFEGLQRRMLIGTAVVADHKIAWEGDRRFVLENTTTSWKAHTVSPATTLTALAILAELNEQGSDLSRLEQQLAEGDVVCVSDAPTLPQDHVVEGWEGLEGLDPKQTIATLKSPTRFFSKERSKVGLLGLFLFVGNATALSAFYLWCRRHVLIGLDYAGRNTRPWIVPLAQGVTLAVSVWIAWLSAIETGPSNPIVLGAFVAGALALITAAWGAASFWRTLLQRRPR